MLHEIKYDGYRTMVGVENGIAIAWSRRGHDWSKKYAPIAVACAALPCQSALIDGEVVVLEDTGASDYPALLSCLSSRPHMLTFVAFDLLHLDGKDLRGRPIEDRRTALRQLIGEPRHPLMMSDDYVGDGAALFAQAEAVGLEGIVSKRKGSRYPSGSNQQDWLKAKCFTTGRFEVVGVETTPGGAPSALLAEDGAYIGQAFVTLKRDVKDAFWRYVEKRAAEAPSCTGVRRRGVTWLQPGLSAEV